MSKLDTLQRNISGHAFTNEQACVQKMLEDLHPLQTLSAAIFTRASALVTRIRENGQGSGVEAFLNTYGLDTREGIAVMCLAEALLRIPDSATADKLIENTFEHTEWNNYLGNSESFFVNASSWGLLLTGSVVNLGNTSQEKPTALIGKLIARMGEPVIRQALKQSMRFIGSQFVLGETIEEALQKSHTQEKKGYRFSYDVLGESARTLAQADGYVQAYHHAIANVGKHNKAKNLMAAPSISVKLSALHPRYHLVQEERVMKELLPRLIGITESAMDAGISISIDAEESARLDVELVIFRRLFSEPMFRNYEGIGFVLQAYQKRAAHIIEYLSELTLETKKRMPVRLVKGAYWDSEIKNAQVSGLSTYPVFTRKEHTDVSYMICAQKLIAHMDLFYPQFATHNALTVATIQELIGAKKETFEFQRLHGMGAHLHDQVVTGTPCRIYAPVGKHKDLLAYLIRRLLENGANTSFVHLLMDKNTPLTELLEDPIEHAKAHKGAQNEMLPNPVHLYSDRKNSGGFDLGNQATLAMLTEKISVFKDCFWHAEPTNSGNHPKNPLAINEPANNSVIVGYVSDAIHEQVGQSICLD